MNSIAFTTVMWNASYTTLKKTKKLKIRNSYDSCVYYQPIYITSKKRIRNIFDVTQMFILDKFVIKSFLNGYVSTQYHIKLDIFPQDYLMDNSLIF